MHIKKFLKSIPDEWLIELKNPNPINADIFPIISLNENLRVVDFQSATSKIFYKFLLNDFFIAPTSEKFWMDKFPTLNLTKVYPIIHLPFLPPDIHCLNYRIVMNSIFTLQKLHRINKVDSDTCVLCNTSPETLEHLFVECDKVQGLRVLLSEILHNSLITGSPINIVIPEYTRLLLFGWQFTYHKNMPVNYYWINFILGVARIAIYKTRQIKVFDNKNIDLKRFFLYTLNKYTEYAYNYYRIKNQMDLFHKYFLKNNPVLKCCESQITLHI